MRISTQLLVGLITIVALCPFGGHAYSLHSGLTEGCHEKITRMALLRTLPELSPSLQVPQPQSTVWERFSEGIIRTNRLNAAFPQLEDEQFRLMMVSTIIGVRSPDTEGHAITNFARLRQIHADPDPVGQYAHALRGPDDDGSNGDLEAIEGLRQVIIGLVTDAFASRQKPPEQQLIKVPLYIDFYGVVDIEVWEPAYLIGRALHAIQDSFSHAIRTDDLKRIRHVLNYVDAIGGHHHEPTDGLPHSDFMDTCVGETEPIAMTASEVSTALVAAINEAAGASSVEPIRAVLDEWMVYEPGCTFENDYCDSSWLALARRDQTGPYLEEMLGCSSMPSASSGVNWDLLMTVLGLSSIILLRRRRRTLALLALGGLLLPGVVDARSFVQAETHVSLLSDAPERSILANTYGGGVRAGYDWEDWSALIQVERSVWVSTELSDATKGGVLNIGLGAQYRSAGGFVRSGAVFGTSTLRYDTVFDDRGTTGIFFDLRPVELCWRPIDWLGIVLTPLSFTYVSPVLHEPPIRMVLYRTNLGLEFGFQDFWR